MIISTGLVYYSILSSCLQDPEASEASIYGVIILSSLHHYSTILQSIIEYSLNYNRSNFLKYLSANRDFIIILFTDIYTMKLFYTRIFIRENKICKYI
jgi:hypothetical protein